MKEPLKSLDEESIKNPCDLFILLHKVGLRSKNAEKGSPNEIVLKSKGRDMKVKL
jgi:hypothetical protein